MAKARKPHDAMRFFAPRTVADLTAARAWIDASAAGDASEVWSGWGDRNAWSVVQLPSARLHPCAAQLFAAAAGVPATAIAAVLEGLAYVDDDGVLRLWPWYPEETAAARPAAVARAAELGLELPRECLDEPYEPAHYLRRATGDALDRWLRDRGVDSSAARIDRVPIPPRAQLTPERYEGGLRAASRSAQAIAAILRTVRLYTYAGEDAEQVARLDAKLDRALAVACARLGGSEVPVAQPAEPQPLALPHVQDTHVEVGRVNELFALHRGAVLVTDGALIAIDRAGAFAGAWARPSGSVFARGDLVIVNYEYVLDLGSGEFITGDLRDVLVRFGLDELPGTGGHDERTEPVISGCGRYLLDIDESPYIIRLADGVTVAEGRALECALDPAKPRGRGLIDEAAIAVAEPMVIDGVRFVVRTGQAPVRDGRSLAFALAGNHWRFLVDNIVRSGGRVIAHAGVPILSGAFRDDGRELWAVSSDHAIRIELDAAPVAACVVALEALLAEADRALNEKTRGRDA